MTWLALGLIKLYQSTVSRVTPSACRFTPTCSHYACEAIERYGLFRGGCMTAKRLARCHPWSAGGYDAVP